MIILTFHGSTTTKPDYLLPRDAGVPEVILGREISVAGGDGGQEVQTGGGLGAELTSGGLPDWVTTGEGLDIFHYGAL